MYSMNQTANWLQLKDEEKVEELMSWSKKNLKSTTGTEKQRTQELVSQLRQISIDKENKTKALTEKSKERKDSLTLEVVKSAFGRKKESLSKKPKFKRTFFRTRREKPRHSVEPSKCEIPRIINLSNLTLSAPEIQILSKGLKFTPTPQTSNYNEVKDDISNFCRKLRLTEELFDKENRDESIVRNKSTYKSSKGKNKALDTFCDHITNFPFNEIQSPKCRPNTSRQEWETIYKLKNNKDIIIKEADKGSAVVVMDLNYYINIANNLLQDNTYYEKVKNYNQTVCKDSIMVSFDVVNLYTTIPHEYGLKAIEFWLENFPSEVPDRIEKKFIIEGIKFILQNNYFNFNGNLTDRYLVQPWEQKLSQPMPI
ncbi:unnamed protein product [Mytilus edulis]|uniref:Reverse transcriptase domain-containing protein n=1 Tax=Mytilus edulis TaxID=6550 RepID=A0A8S3PP33_MYTED|nr:unnamed protein product [Mytilus edulis]